MKKIFLILLSSILVLFLVLIFPFISNTDENIKVYNEIITEQKENIKEIDEEIEIIATGDIMYHLPIYINRFDTKTNTYEFKNHFSKIEDEFKKADLVIGNLETTIDVSRPPSGFPMFNTPKEALLELKNAGFDVLSTANNHCVDTLKGGIISTIDEINKVGIKHFGTRKFDKRDNLIINIKGRKIGFIGYSELFNGMDSALSSEDKFMISPLNYDDIINDLTELRNRGAEFIICYPHWGVEYQSVPSSIQEDFNKFLIDNGVDVVLGSHPHVPQEARFYNINGKKQFTIFSMGNFFSNQRTSYVKKPLVESSVVVKLKLVSNSSGIKLKDVELVPMYVNKYNDEKGRTLEVVKYSDILDGGKYRDILTNQDKNFVDDNYKKIMERLNK